MRRSAFSDAEMSTAVSDLLAGRPAQEICATFGISPRTLFRWRRRLSDLKPFAVRALRQLEQENHRLKLEALRAAAAPPAAPPPAVAAATARSDLGPGRLTDATRVATVVGRYAALRLR